MDHLRQDQVVMQDGQVMRMENGEMVPVREGLTMADGSRVMPDGTVRMADGTSRMMDEGEMMTIAGSVPEMSDRAFKENMEDEENRDDM